MRSPPIASPHTFLQAGETRAEKREKEKTNKALMEAEMKAYLEKEESKEVAQAGAFRRPSTGHRARQRIATPGDMAGGGARSGSASSAGGKVTPKRTPRRFGM